MIKICINDTDILVKPLYLSQDLHEEPSMEIYWMFLLIELILGLTVVIQHLIVFTYISCLSML